MLKLHCTSGKVEARLWPPFFNALSIECSENAIHDHLVRLYVQQNATSNIVYSNVVFKRQLSLSGPWRCTATHVF